MLSYAKIRNGARSELIAHKKNRIVSIILLGFAGLFYGFGMNAYAYYVTNSTDIHSSVYPHWAALLIYVISLICLFTACIGVFKDMHDIPSADVQMSMPMNSTERYLSRLLSIFYIWLLPFLISAAFGFLVSLCMGNAGHSDRIGTTLASAVPYISIFNINILLCYTETVLFIISATVICQCCVGSKAESKYMPILVMAVTYFLPMAVYYFISDKFAQVDDDTVSLLSGLAAFEMIDDEKLEIPVLIYLCVRCLIYIGVIFCGAFIYKKRDARSVGRPIVFSLFFEIVTALTLLLFFCLAHMDGFGLLAIFFAWLGSIILRVIASRREFAFKKLLIWTGLFLAYYLAFLLFMFIAFKTGGFGSLYRLPRNPEFSNYASVYVEVEKPVRSQSLYGYDRFSYAEDYTYRKEINCNIADNKALVRQIMKYAAGTAKSQSRVDGLFSEEMFESGNPEACRCTVRINTSEVPSDSDDYYRYDRNRIYSITFYMPKEERGDFYEKINSVKFIQ